MTKMLSVSGGSVPGPRWGLCPQTPVIGSCSALAMVLPNHWPLPPPMPVCYRVHQKPHRTTAKSDFSESRPSRTLHSRYCARGQTVLPAVWLTAAVAVTSWYTATDVRWHDVTRWVVTSLRVTSSRLLLSDDILSAAAAAAATAGLTDWAMHQYQPSLLLALGTIIWKTAFRRLTENQEVDRMPRTIIKWAWKFCSYSTRIVCAHLLFIVIRWCADRIAAILCGA